MTRIGLSQVVSPQKRIFYPYFALPEDSATYAQIGSQFREAFKTKNADKKVIDSLSIVFNSTLTKLPVVTTQQRNKEVVVHVNE